MSKETRDNQALYSHMLMFDPVDHAPAPPLDVSPKGVKRPAGPGPEHRIGGTFKEVRPYRTLEDGSFELTFHAPDAHSVKVMGIVGAMKDGYDLEKAENGFWKVVIEKPTPGFHFVYWLVDGVRTLHPNMPFAYGAHLVMNYLEIAAPGVDFYLCQDVPHGVLMMEQYYSELIGRWRNAWVYTPPSYFQNPDRRYPVMFIQHGGGENEMGWFWIGKLNYIADNLIARGECEEMLIVCCSGDVIRRREDGLCENLNYADVMAQELVPMIDERFRTIGDREHRAVCGLSMGGGQARSIAHTHPELFANLGQFSSGGGFPITGEYMGNPVDYSNIFQGADYYNKLMKVTFVTCGTEDPRHVYTEPQVRELQEQGYNIVYREYPGDHEWNPWRESARDFMKMLFK